MTIPISPWRGVRGEKIFVSSRTFTDMKNVRSELSVLHLITVQLILYFTNNLQSRD